MSINISEDTLSKIFKGSENNPSKIMQKYDNLFKIILIGKNTTKKKEINKNLSSVFNLIQSMFDEINKSIEFMNLPNKNNLYGLNNNLKQIINNYLNKVCKFYLMSILRSNGEIITGDIYIGITNYRNKNQYTPSVIVRNGTIFYFPINEIEKIEAISKK